MKLLSTVLLLFVALLAAGLSVHCNDSTPRDTEPESRPQPVKPASEEWKAFVKIHEGAATYYRDFGTRSKPYTEARNNKTESDLSNALAAVGRRGDVSKAELELLVQITGSIDRWGGRKSRNIVSLGGGEPHYDGIPRWPGTVEYYHLEKCISPLQDIANQQRHNRRLLQWSLPRLQRWGNVLSKPSIGETVDFYESLGPDWKKKDPAPITSMELAKKTRSLIDTIERNAGMTPTSQPSNSKQ